MNTLSDVLEAPASQPCRLCKALIPDRALTTQSSQIETSWELTDLYPDYPLLEQSGTRGCGFCSLVRHTLCFMATAESKDFDPNGTHYFWENGEDHLLKLSWDRKVKITAHFIFSPFEPLGDHGQFNLSGQPPQYNGMVTQLRLHYTTASDKTLTDGKGNYWHGSVVDIHICDSPDLWADDPKQRSRLPSPETLSKENVTMMQAWIDDCATNHGHGCSIAFKQVSWIPSRLIEICSGGSASDMTLRIVETSPSEMPHPQRATFAALSHMWGDMTNKPPLCTFKSNLEQMKKEIRLGDLPSNFSDAIYVCVQLGIKYLWIDSLCIIQDSAEDWKHEAGLMNLVYQTAKVTIVATSATSCHDGFLQRNIASSPAVKIPYSIGGGVEQFFIAYYHKRVLENNRLHAVDLSKWNTRGWTMQERSLSTRSIHFGRAKIFFECRNCFLSEGNTPEEEFSSSSSVLWPRGKSVSSRELDDRWENFVVTYCDRNLTHGTDKLPAIRSVAAQIFLETGHEYFNFAGVWRHSLASHLLWHCWIGKVEVPKKPRAPSWSWASLDASIVFSHPPSRDSRMPRRPQLESLSSRLKRSPFEVLQITEAPPLGGYIRVLALTQPVSALERVGNTGKWRVFFPYDMVIADEERNRSVVAHGRLDLDRDSTALTPGARCTYLHINNDTRCNGLILQLSSPPDGASHGQVWKRVGVASLFSDESGLLLSSPFEDNCQRSSVTII